MYLPSRLSRTGPARPRGDHDGDVCFKRKINNGFELDVDMCSSGPKSCPDAPIENVVFPSPSLSIRQRSRKLVPGQYKIMVRHFAFYNREGKRLSKGPSVPFDVLFTLDGKKTLITGLCTKPYKKGQADPVFVATFTVGVRGKVISMTKHPPMDCGRKGKKSKVRRLTQKRQTRKENRQTREGNRKKRRGEL